MHVLRLEEQAPTPRAREHHRQVEQQRRGEPEQRGMTRVAPQARHVDPREQKGEQRDADDGFQHPERERTPAPRALDFGFGTHVANMSGRAAGRPAQAESVARRAGARYNGPFRSMRILMIAPEPFFEPRGTPFSEYHRIRALLDLGHTVDLVTYPFGRDMTLRGLQLFRC